MIPPHTPATPIRSRTRRSRLWCALGGLVITAAAGMAWSAQATEAPATEPAATATPVATTPTQPPAAGGTARAPGAPGAAAIGPAGTAAPSPAAPGIARRATAPASGARLAGGDGPAWAALSPAQRQALAPLERDWASIEAPRKAKWLDVASRMPTLSAEEQQRIRERMVEWARMSPAERGRARLTFLDTKQLSADEKQARWEAYRSLPESERQALAARQRASERPHTALAARPAASAAASGVAVASGAARTTSASGAARPASAPAPKPVSPSLVQGKPGATTMLMNRQPAPPPHQQPGQPRIAVNTGDVDPQTLLPRNGPQAASTPAQALHP